MQKYKHQHERRFSTASHVSDEKWRVVVAGYCMMIEIVKWPQTISK